MSQVKKGIFGATPASAEETAQTVLPTGCSVDGKLVCAGPARIDGNVTGELVADDLLVVDRNATVVANLDVRELIVRGEVRGDVKAAVRIVLADTARVEGDICAPTISIDDGAQVAGKIEIRRDAANSNQTRRTDAAA